MMARSVGPIGASVDDAELENELAELLLDTDTPSDNQGGQTSFSGELHPFPMQINILQFLSCRIARSADDASGGGNTAHLPPPLITK